MPQIQRPKRHQRTATAVLSILLVLGATWVALAGPQPERNAMNPEQQAVMSTIHRMTGAFEAGQIDTVMSTYEPGATVVFQPGAPVSSHDALKRMFTEAAAINPSFTYSGHEVFISGDIALHLAPWKMSATLPDGSTVQDTGLSVAVLRRQTDGQWLMVIDDPHGTALLKE